MAGRTGSCDRNVKRKTHDDVRPTDKKERLVESETGTDAATPPPSPPPPCWVWDALIPEDDSDFESSLRLHGGKGGVGGRCIAKHVLGRHTTGLEHSHTHGWTGKPRLDTLLIIDQWFSMSHLLEK